MRQLRNGQHPAGVHCGDGFSGCQWAFSRRLVGGLLGAMEANAVRLEGPVGPTVGSADSVRVWFIEHSSDCAHQVFALWLVR